MATLYGGFFGDFLTGTSGNDEINGNGGSDTVNAGDGEDQIYGGDGNDSLVGGNGYDVISGDSGDDKLYGGNDAYSDLFGGAGNDSIYAGDADEDWAWGGDGQDLVYLGGGADLGYGGAGQDTVYGGDGNDMVSGAFGNDSIYGDAGADSVYGGAGRDTVDGGADNDTLGGGAGSDSILGGTGNDLIHGDHDAFVSTLDASQGPIDTNITITNSAPFAIDVYWIDTAGMPQLFATVQPGASFSASTGTTHNWFVAQNGSTVPLQVIHGAANQTVVFGPNFNDTLAGGAGDDTIFSDYGSDSLFGDAGNDSLIAGDGNDTGYGGDGNDIAWLGAGNDSFGNVGTEAGSDTVDGGAGNDTIYGGEDNDQLTGGAGADTVYGGSGADVFAVGHNHDQDLIYGGEAGTDFDTISFASTSSAQGVVVTFTGSEAGWYDYAGTTGAGSFTEIEAITGTSFADTLDASLSGVGQTLSAGIGDDLIKGGAGADTIYFGSGNDTVFGGAGHDLIDDISGGAQAGTNYIDAGTGDDTVWAGDGDDTIDGGDGGDFVGADTGNDVVRGGAGNDSLYGSAGNDTLQGGTGSDLLYGGAGRDSYQFVTAGGGDIIADFDLGLVASQTTDRLDTSDLRNPDGSIVHGWDVQITDDGNGNAKLTFPMGESVVLQGASPTAVAANGMLAAMGVPCFASGTMIATPNGLRQVQDIAVGDMVNARDGPALPVIWRGSQHLTAAELAEAPHLRPIRIAPGILGNLRALILSPQHAVLVPGTAQGLIRARHLAALGWRARIAHGMRGVCYHHLLLPHHALIRAEGAWVESFYPGPMAVAALPVAHRQALAIAISALGLSNETSLTRRYGPRCLPLLDRKAATSALRAAGEFPFQPKGPDRFQRPEAESLSANR